RRQGQAAVGQAGVAAQQQQVVGVAQGADAVGGGAGQVGQGHVERVEVEVAQQWRQGAALDQAAGALPPQPAAAAAARLQDGDDQGEQVGVGDVARQLGEQQAVIDGV